ncbi:hypothetical protein L3X38_041549 [Prunus dulcis]|uniref:Uncharacterized protein n=1 Tax=Prunus dulcis TaxID=3755 RepID=A0AAD4UUZ2_PRUDU|nr:hypothetical protein L3X38_041549 [Prunus dulcis]
MKAQASKGQGKDIADSKAQMGESRSVPSNLSKKMRFTSSSKKVPSSATFDEVTKSTRGINIMSRVVKRKIQEINPVVEYNKRCRVTLVFWHTVESFLWTRNGLNCPRT